MKKIEPYSPFDTVEVKKRFDVKKNYTWDLESVKGFLFYYAQDEMFLNKEKFLIVLSYTCQNG